MDRDRSQVNAATRGRVGRIVVRGEFGPLLGAALPECEIVVLSGETHLTAYVRDEAELYGLLQRLRDLGAELARVAVDRSGVFLIALRDSEPIACAGLQRLDETTG